MEAETQTCKDAGGRKDRLTLGVAVATERHSEECDSDVEQSDSCTCAYVARQMSAPPFTKDKPSPDKNRLKMQVFMLLRVILHSSYYSFTLK